MTTNEDTIIKFYTAFSNGDATQMCECYHPNIKFSDPVFGLLKGKDVCKMWKMLLEKSKGNIKIDFSEIKADDYKGSARWVATYNFSKTNRKVVNSIYAQFQFKEGLIIKHTDDFDIWKWSKQAFGLKGILLGWTGFMQKRIQKQALSSLNKYEK
ncbi:SnoaL-like domain-containing protein [Flavobacterium fluvii]|uniref:SnoaL-like domain-containing protein n=1 Tax=Flavobacterium fluvii TaxID=468056 RepID=A0A1M5N421_9FLAO|nr:nuclear transport factor 2 family protein [Flavobacterium fluvii]SHG84271.1 SnoaL-like domain-containing protein [Flavobacterium fluvii]